MKTGNVIFVKSIILCFSIYMYSNGNALAQGGVNVEIKSGRETGRIRALNGGALSPVCNLKLLDLSEEFKELHIPLIRLHDAPWFNDNVVDIHTIFSDFRRDPADEQNYDFRKTDDYIKSIIKTGTGIVFRLGESIEHTEVNYYVNPPADFKKWAEICCGIIRHYNNGWANGSHHNIKFWEVWNEPDEQGKMWTGTEKQFIDFYAVAAKRIKAEFPDVMVGGPAFSHPFLFQDGKYVPSNMATSFLSYCRDKSIPLDFFSWHSYDANPWAAVNRASLVRDLLDKFGFKKTENHMNEWNYIPGEKWDLLMDKEFQGRLRSEAYAGQYGCKGASFIANVLMLLQDAPVDMANYYTTTAGLFGVFSEYGEPRKSYYAFKAFAELLKTPVRVETNYNKADSVVVCSGVNSERSRLTILASNFSSKARKINFKLPDNSLGNSIKVAVYIIDETHDLAKINEYNIHGTLLEFSENLPSSSVLMLVCQKN